MYATALAWIAAATIATQGADFPRNNLLKDPAAARTFDYWRLREGRTPEAIAPLRASAYAAMNVKNPDDPGRCFTDSEIEILSGLKNAEKATSAQQWRDDRDAAAGAVHHFDQTLVSLMAGGSSGDKQLDQSVRPFLDRARSDKTARGRELARRVALDQAVRRGIGSDAMFGAVAFTARPVLDRSLMNRICRIDADNVAWIKREVRNRGWFEISRYGPEAEKDAWLLVQHADDDIAFQTEILALLDTLRAKGETYPKNYAYLYDRVATHSGRPQRYGTQGGCRDGKRFTFPLEDPKRVDQLRAEVGMPTLADYNARFTCRR